MSDLSLNQRAALTEGKSNSVFDIAKFVLCVMIVALHTELAPYILNPWLKMAVPLFFMISSYFLWSKILQYQSWEDKKNVVRRFVERNLKLYAFWCLLWLPVTLIYRRYFSGGIVVGFLRVLRSLFFSSTFGASWFIMALLISCVCVFYLSRFVSDKILLAASLILHILIVLRTSYYPDILPPPPRVQMCVIRR